MRVERVPALWRVDILAPAIKRFDGKLQLFPMPESVGSIGVYAFNCPVTGLAEARFGG
jgi:hypothetical protein